jgi:hypothetical protein
MRSDTLSTRMMGAANRYRLPAWALLAVAAAWSAALLLHFGLSGKGFDSTLEVPFSFLLYAPVGAVIALKRPENSIGWLYMVIGVSNALGFAARELFSYSLLTQHGALPGTEWAALVASLMANVAWPGVFLSLMLFPDGRFLSRRWRAIGYALLLQTLALAFLDTFSAPTLWDASYPNPFRFAQVEGLYAFYVWLQSSSGITLMLCLIPVALRFLRSRGEQRAQIKLFVYAASLFLVPIALTAVTWVFPALNGSIVSDVSGLLAYLWLAAMPLSIGLAILRYRLYNIDIIIRRTLVYGALTGVLGLLYWGGVVGLQALLRPITGEGNDLAIVATTLAVAALFLPLRQRIQGFIDRRFYRRKYDAAKTLTAFSEHARDEVELDRLTGRLVEVVVETMQPAHISIWLRPVVENRDHSV